MIYLRFFIWLLFGVVLPGLWIYSWFHSKKKIESFVTSAAFALAYGLIFLTIFSMLFSFWGLYTKGSVVFSLVVLGLFVIKSLNNSKNELISKFVDAFNAEKRHVWFLVVVLVFSYIYYANPVAIFHESDSLFWIAQARQIVADGGLPPSSFAYIFAPLLHSSLLATVMTFVGEAVSYAGFLRLVAPFYLMLLIMGIYSFIRNVVGKVSISVFLYAMLGFFTSSWTLGTVLGADLSPRLIGVFLMLLAFIPVWDKKWRSEGLINFIYLLFGIIMLHYTEALFLMIPIILAFPISRRVRRFVGESPLIIFPMLFVGGRVINFLMYSLLPLEISYGSVGSYNQIVYGVDYLIGHYGVMMVVLAFIGVITYLGSSKEKKEAKKIMLVMGAFMFLVLREPIHFTMNAKAFWSTYRNIVYFSVPLMLFSVSGFLWIQRKINIKPLRNVLVVLVLGFQLVMVAREAGKIYFSRIGHMPGNIYARLEEGIKSKLDLTERSQDVHRKSLEFFERIRPVVEKEKIYIDISNGEVNYYAVGLLSSNEIVIPNYTVNPVIYPWFSQKLYIGEASDESIGWMVLDSVSLQNIEKDNIKLVDEIDFLVSKRIDISNNQSIGTGEECRQGTAVISEKLEDGGYSGMVEWLSVELLTKKDIKPEVEFGEYRLNFEKVETFDDYFRWRASQRIGEKLSFMEGEGKLKLVNYQPQDLLLCSAIMIERYEETLALYEAK